MTEVERKNEEERNKSSAMSVKERAAAAAKARREKTAADRAGRQQPRAKPAPGVAADEVGDRGVRAAGVTLRAELWVLPRRSNSHSHCLLRCVYTP